MPKILRDTQKDCGKPGCLNDNRIQVLARGDEMIEQERRLPPLALFGHGRAGRRCPLSGVQRKSSLDSLPSSRGDSNPWSQVRKYFERR
jgi:hypothetical protein